jgi:hypothetical protein
MPEGVALNPYLIQQYERLRSRKTLAIKHTHAAILSAEGINQMKEHSGSAAVSAKEEFVAAPCAASELLEPFFGARRADISADVPLPLEKIATVTSGGRSRFAAVFCRFVGVRMSGTVRAHANTEMLVDCMRGSASSSSSFYALPVTCVRA